MSNSARYLLLATVVLPSFLAFPLGAEKISPGLQQSDASQGTCVLSGRVLNSQTGEPVPGAVVKLRAAGIPGG